MVKFNYEYYTVDVIYTVGKMTTEFKGRDRDHVIKQIKSWMVRKNKQHTDTSIPWWKRGEGVKEIIWETLKLDRTGHQR